jgi:MoxR-like ATPase
VVPDDLKGMARPVLQHRLTLTPEARLGSVEANDVLDDVLRSVPVPTGRG